MSDITEWSPTASSNNATPPNGFPEGMLPSVVNDACRELMAAIRRFIEDSGWFDWGHTCTRITGTTFTVATDLTSVYHAGRRIKVTGSTTGTIYGNITSSVFSSVTTVTIVWDSGSMADEAITVYLGLLLVDALFAKSTTAGFVKNSATGGLSGGNSVLITDIPAGVEVTANKGEASGYAELDSGTKVPTDQLGGAGADATKFLRGDQSWEAVNASTPYALIQDQKASGTDGGTFTSGAWQVRDLNTEVIDSDNIVTLAANQFTLQAGTYRIRAVGVASQVYLHKLALYNVTDIAYTCYGMNAWAYGSSGNMSELVIEFTIAGTKVFELHHRCSNTIATTGFGNACSFGVSEIYAQVEIWKVA